MPACFRPDKSLLRRVRERAKHLDLGRDTDLNTASSEWAEGQKAAVPLDRYGQVDEVAALVAFVAGPESSYINGANLTVDGGINACPQVESKTKQTASCLPALGVEMARNLPAQKCCDQSNERVSDPNEVLGRAD